jgi:hypothetical protein
LPSASPAVRRRANTMLSSVDVLADWLAGSMV